MKVLIYGSRLFGQVIRCLVEDCGHEFAGFIDDIYPGEGVLGPFSSVLLTHPPAEYVCVNAVGYSDLGARRTVSARIQKAGYTMPVLVHPKAHISAASSVGPGSFVMAGALVDCRVALEDNVVVWPGVCVSHDCSVGGNTFLSPNCTVCGDCRVGADCFVGAGAVIVSHATVPDRTRIKALERYVTRRSARE
jgi:sugar O-acyltransferase (sialic acid O-acetyltransferase NeuD family)